MKILFPLLAASTLIACHPAQANERFGAVVVYAAPLEPGGPSGQAFSAPTEAQVLDIAIQSCKANTIKEQWANCAVGRWIGTARYLLVADVCKAVDENGDPHKVLFFSKDGVAATDDEIQQDAGLRINHGWIPPKGCTKIAVYDRDKPARTEPEESLVVRSVAKDKAH